MFPYWSNNSRILCPFERAATYTSTCIFPSFCEKLKTSPLSVSAPARRLHWRNLVLKYIFFKYFLYNSKASSSPSTFFHTMGLPNKKNNSTSLMYLCLVLANFSVLYGFSPFTHLSSRLITL